MGTSKKVANNKPIVSIHLLWSLLGYSYGNKQVKKPMKLSENWWFIYTFSRLFMFIQNLSNKEANILVYYLIVRVLMIFDLIINN